MIDGRTVKGEKMIIFTQNKQAVWNFDDMSRLHVTGTGTGIQAVGRNGSGGEIARYRNREWCVYALEMLISAIEAGDKTFTFPNEREMEHRTAHGVSGGGKRHGGS